MKQAINRRDFLKGAAIVGAGAAGAIGLSGCSPTQQEESGASSSLKNTQSGSCPEGYVVAEDWLGEPPAISEDDITETVDVEVVVCGGGIAGTQAALAAAEEGASVAVIEKQEEDTWSVWPDDICAYNSQLMLERGFGPYDTGEIVAEFIRRGCGRVNPEIIKMFVENSGEMFDNMMKYVPDTSNIFDYSDNWDDTQYIIQIAHDRTDGSQYPYEVSGYKAWASTVQTIGSINPTPVNGRENVGRVTELCIYMMLGSKDLGAQWYFGHSATVLEQNENGDVTGVIAQNPDGGYTRFNASKGVLLATGDFGANPDMVYNLCDDINELGARVDEDREDMCFANAQDGTGHKMGCWAGGMIEPHPRGAMNANGGTPGPWGTSPVLCLNGNGYRFANEAMAQTIAAACGRQPLTFLTAITDANYMKSVEVAGCDHGAPNWGAPSFMEAMQNDMAAVPVDDPAGAEVTDVANINKQRGKTAVVYAANTLETLLGYLGYEGEALETALSSIEHYNELCANGSDTDFGKDSAMMIPVDTPPFYGSVLENSGQVNVGLVTVAGLVTNNQLNVLQADHTTPIKGLYAAGNCLGGRYGIAYCTPSAGNSVGMAMTHGRQAGKIIAGLDA